MNILSLLNLTCIWTGRSKIYTHTYSFCLLLYPLAIPLTHSSTHPSIPSQVWSTCRYSGTGLLLVEGGWLAARIGGRVAARFLQPQPQIRARQLSALLRAVAVGIQTRYLSIWFSFAFSWGTWGREGLILGAFQCYQAGSVTQLTFFFMDDATN